MSELVAGRLTAFWQRCISDQHRAWYSGVIRGSLWLASLGYGAISRLRNRLYDCGFLQTERVPVPVISVGNLTVGGTGKTPLVAWLARQLASAGVNVAVLSRGYGAQGRIRSETSGSNSFVPSQSPANPCSLNDEACELLWELPSVPHYQGSDRVSLAHRAIADGAEVLVLDDGYQHRRLLRDIDIVLVDATNPWGYGSVLPRGLLREHKTELARADVVVLSRCDLVTDRSLLELQREIATHAPRATIALTRHAPKYLLNTSGAKLALAALSGWKVLAFCGIGSPHAFLTVVRQLGADIVASRVFPDHCSYSQKMAQLEHWVQAFPNADAVITTRKDLVKLPGTHLAGKPLWAIVIELEWIDGEVAVWRRVREVVLRHNHQPVRMSGKRSADLVQQEVTDE